MIIDSLLVHAGRRPLGEDQRLKRGKRVAEAPEDEVTFYTYTGFGKKRSRGWMGGGGVCVWGERGARMNANMGFEDENPE